MVQRMFELAKSHVFGTGYKLREAISKGLKSRSQAIRTAVTRYNELAELLDPPAAPVNFATLMEWTELQEFELLRRSRAGDVRDKAWAQPANRLVASRHYKILRASEELVRCRVEARRLTTAMDDEERAMNAACEQLGVTNPALGHELRELIIRRTSVNTLHRATLAKLAALPGFADVLVAGVRLGSPPSPAHERARSSAAEDVPHHPVAEEHGEWSGGVDEADGHEVEEQELHVLHDYLANLDDS